jgi:ATP-dependent helicase/nuclease subunit A
MKTPPHDQFARAEFAEKLQQNFSVIAAAGTGKTTAITKRIAAIARHRPDWLPRLVVVTFTNRAADEMQQRARQRIFELGVPLDVLNKFNRAFFGTIHSFCTKLLAQHGHHLGLPSRLELITDDEELWNEFVQRTDSLRDSLSPENRKALLRHVQLRDLMDLGRRGKLPLGLEQRNFDCPPIIDLKPLYTFRATRGSPQFRDLQQQLRDWQRLYDDGANFLPLPNMDSGVAGFCDARHVALREVYDWLSCCALAVAAGVQRDYRRFRAEHGVVTFDDQIAFAHQLIKNESAIVRIREKDYIVILDEAQDTDPQQFEVLLEVTRPPHASGSWLRDFQEPPRPGRFCMVGDFQQSIYGDRADLKQYRRIHDALIESGAGEELKFSVTFRLDQKQIDFINECFHDILNDRDGQIAFIRLDPRPEKLPGQVVRLDITPGDLDPKARDLQKAEAEAAELARWIRKTGLDRLRARLWGQVAILCPRKKWFAPIADALRREGVDSQIQSETDVKGDSPAYAWLTALLTIMTQPRCGFEIVGVLREVFGISDHDLAIFSDGYGDRFQIETPNNRRAESQSSSTGSVLDLLAHLHAEIADKPLFTAVKRVVEGTQLRERLRTLPKEDFENLEDELDVLWQSAATAEAEGATLEQFAELLRANLIAERETGTPRTEALQLITCQKAKGLEWDAVIVPFFSRKIYNRDDDFPRLIVDPKKQEAIVAFSDGDVPPGAKDTLQTAHLQEMERLLYVALTRARHTLVLAADNELFGPAPTESLTTWLRSDPGKLNERLLMKLDARATACAKTRAQQSRWEHMEEESQKITDLPKLRLTAAERRAAEFFRQSNPSTLLGRSARVEETGADVWKEIESEFRARTLPSPATRYGVWWHEFAQKIPWQSPPDAWQVFFDASVVESPDPARSKREWKLLTKYASAHREFFVATILAEMPFLWRIDDQNCLEGLVDLALFRPDEKRWFILDWKTNRIRPLPDQLDNLRVAYRPQIAAYWKAVMAMTNQTVSAGIYSTATGQLLAYDEDELADAWEHLRMVATDQYQVASEINRIEVKETGKSNGQLEFGGW